MKTKSKQGLSYFPFSTDFLTDLKTRRLMKVHGPELVYLYIHPLSVIYKYEGYYARYDEDLIFILSESMYLDENRVAALVGKCVEVGLFDRSQWEGNGILTSEEIQENYLFAVKRRKSSVMKPEYRIENEEVTFVSNTKETKCIHDVYKTEQIESKIKKKKKEEVVEEEKEKKAPVIEKHTVTPSNLPTTATAATWRNDFKIYKNDLKSAFIAVMADQPYLDRKQRLYPDMDISKTFEKIITEYWGTRAGWEHKRRTSGDTIDWRSTFDKQLTHPYNIIQKRKEYQPYRH